MGTAPEPLRHRDHVGRDAVLLIGEKVPVRPIPVCTSSTMSSAPTCFVRFCNAFIHRGSAAMSPLRPGCTRRTLRHPSVNHAEILQAVERQRSAIRDERRKIILNGRLGCERERTQCSPMEKRSRRKSNASCPSPCARA